MKKVYLIVLSIGIIASLTVFSFFNYNRSNEQTIKISIDVSSTEVHHLVTELYRDNLQVHCIHVCSTIKIISGKIFTKKMDALKDMLWQN